MTAFGAADQGHNKNRKINYNLSTDIKGKLNNCFSSSLGQVYIPQNKVKGLYNHLHKAYTNKEKKKKKKPYLT